MPPKPKQTMPVTPLRPEDEAQINEMREMAKVMPQFWPLYDGMKRKGIPHETIMTELRTHMPRSYEDMREEAAKRKELEGQGSGRKYDDPNRPPQRVGEEPYLREPEKLPTKKPIYLPPNPNAPKKRPIKKKKGAMIDDMYESAMSSGK